MSDTINIQIGKNGFNESVEQEIKKHLKAKKNVKLKFLKSFIGDKDRTDVAKEIQQKFKNTGKLIGNTIVIKYNDNS